MSETKTQTWQPTKDGGWTIQTTILVTAGYSIVETKPLRITAYDDNTVEGTIVSSRIVGEDEQQ